RLLARPGDHTSLALWELEVAPGPGRTLEPCFANLVNLGLLVEYDQNVQVNSLLGADLETQLAGLTVFGQVLIDDVQIDRRTQADSEPPSYGLTLGAQGAVGGVSWTAYYTRVTNLTYRTPNPAETVERRFVGLGRGFSDYDQATLTANVIAAPGTTWRDCSERWRRDASWWWATRCSTCTSRGTPSASRPRRPSRW